MSLVSWYRPIDIVFTCIGADGMLLLRNGKWFPVYILIWHYLCQTSLTFTCELKSNVILKNIRFSKNITDTSYNLLTIVKHPCLFIGVFCLPFYLLLSVLSTFAFFEDMLFSVFLNLMIFVILWYLLLILLAAELKLDTLTSVSFLLNAVWICFMSLYPLDLQLT